MGFLMRAGRLRDRVQLEKNVPSEDPVDGAQREEWVHVATVWGELRDLRGREYLAAREIHAAASAQIRIRYRPGLEPLLWRAVVAGAIYNIEHVARVGNRPAELELLVSKIE